MNDNLNELVVGFPAMINPAGSALKNYIICTVSKVTKTQVTVSYQIRELGDSPIVKIERRFLLDSGKEVGSDSWHRAYLYLYDEAKIKERNGYIDSNNRKAKLREQLEDLKTKISLISIDQIEKLEKLFAEILP